MLTSTASPWACGCDDEPPPALSGDAFPDLGFVHMGDGGPDPRLDGGFLDADPNDQGPAPSDGGDGGGGDDADAGSADVKVPDAGPSNGDRDGDRISDRDEGYGFSDADGDGTADWLDLDSDNDGILDQDEAGDLEVSTQPRDVDRDGLPDFRDPDSDNDGIPDAIEGLIDSDGDGAPDLIDSDSDGDGIPDRVEGVADPDQDGQPNYLDLDSDGDTILDRLETAYDTDGDGTPNYLDLDADDDGIPDAIEGLWDLDGDGLMAFVDIDADGDNLLDELEGTVDSDGDGFGDWLDLDADGDSIRDLEEGLADPDGDGTPAYLDLDSDGDGIVDELEAGDLWAITAAADHDFDGTPDFLDLDSDNDTILDAVEGLTDSDLDGMSNFVDVDSDNDGVLDLEEAGDLSLATAPVDSDGDLVPDYLDLDSDGDTIADEYEYDDSDQDGISDRLELDSDGDGLSDATEAGDADPLTPPRDSDQDGRGDFRELDSDADGLGDAVEVGCPGSTERTLADSDADGYLDTAELATGTLPCDPNSGVPGFYFVLPPNGPNGQATLTFDDTGIDRADLAINIDTTGSMGGEITALRNSLASLIIPGAQAVVPDPTFAVSCFEDFPVAPFGVAASGDLPYRLGTRATQNQADVQQALNALATKNGDDLPESGLESLYQIATGAGAQWGDGPGQSIPAFDPAQGLVPGIADGTIGGVGFRDNSLPIVVHVTDAPSQVPASYQAIDPEIQAVEPAVALSAINQIGARVITIASSALPNPVPATTLASATLATCTRQSGRFYGRIDGPRENDVDWYRLVGASAGQTITVDSFADRWGSTLNVVLGVFDRNGVPLLVEDNGVPGSTDAALSVVLSGPTPYYLAVTGYNDTDFNTTGAVSAGFYFLDVVINGQAFTKNPVGCSASDEGDTRANATHLVALTAASGPADAAACAAQCVAMIEPERLRQPYGISQATGASIPACAWDLFGPGRPAGCADDQCCTGLNGAGEAPDENGVCPLSFHIDSTGAGLGQAVVDGLQALVQFSEFTITTSARPDPVALGDGVDTTCFLHGIVPDTATPPNLCAPTPTAVDLTPPSPALDSWSGVVPATVLRFTVTAENRVGDSSTPCVAATESPQLFRAFIDVIADGVTVVDTREVTVVVPPRLVVPE